MTENIVQKLREEIENDIMRNEFEPGSRLEEKVLAKRYGVSRTPVREALLQLDAIGLVEIRPRRGTVVVDPGPHRIYEMFEVMAELEGLAAELAARRLTDEDRNRLLAAHSRCELSAKADGGDAYFHDNESFHEAIYAASHSSFLEEHCKALNRRIRPYRRLQLRVRNRTASSFAEHCAIVDAIIKGEADHARSLLKHHIAIQIDRFGDLMASLQRKRGIPVETDQ